MMSCEPCISASFVEDEPHGGTPSMSDNQHSESSSSDVPTDRSTSLPPVYQAKSQMLSSSVHSTDVKAESFACSWFLVLFYHVSGVLTFGLVYLITYWRPDWKVYMCCNRVVLARATHLVVTSGDGKAGVVTIEDETVPPEFPEHFRIDVNVEKRRGSWLEDGASLCSSSSHGSLDEEDNCRSLLSGNSSRFPVFRYRHFMYQHVKFVWCPCQHRFVELTALDRGTPITELMARGDGCTDQQRGIAHQLYGPNEITVKVRSYMSLLFLEVLNPYYIFQVASIILWCMDDYYLYASCIVLLSGGSVFMALRQTRQQSERIHAMVHISQDVCVSRLRREHLGDHVETVTVPVTELVPGDVLLLPPLSEPLVLPCDCALLAGTAIVNESMLTGESVPVTKTALSLTSAADPLELYDPDRHRRSTLFCGTAVIQTRYYDDVPVRALVVRTGFSTTKGELVRSILFPKPMLFQFYLDSMKFIAVLFLIACIGMGYTMWLYVVRGVTIGIMAVRALDLVTIVVPPALPAAMTVGTYYSHSRLKEKQVFCVSPPRINVAGKTKLVCFDKTGTLTEDHLEVYGVVGIDKLKNTFDSDDTFFIENQNHQSSKFNVEYNTSSPVKGILPNTKEIETLIKVTDQSLFTSNSKAAVDIFEVNSTVSPSNSPLPPTSTTATAATSCSPDRGAFVLWPAVRPVHELSHDSSLMVTLAVCHDLTYVHGTLVGDPMDIKMFQSTGWVLEEPVAASYENLMLTVLRPPVRTLQLLPPCPLPETSSVHIPPPSPHPVTYLPTPIPAPDPPEGRGGGEGFFPQPPQYMDSGIRVDLQSQAYLYCPVHCPVASKGLDRAADKLETRLRCDGDGHDLAESCNEDGVVIKVHDASTDVCRTTSAGAMIDTSYLSICTCGDTNTTCSTGDAVPGSSRMMVGAGDQPNGYLRDVSGSSCVNNSTSVDNVSSASMIRAVTDSSACFADDSFDLTQTFHRDKVAIVNNNVIKEPIMIVGDGAAKRLASSTRDGSDYEYSNYSASGKMQMSLPVAEEDKQNCCGNADVTHSTSVNDADMSEGDVDELCTSTSMDAADGVTVLPLSAAETRETLFLNHMDASKRKRRKVCASKESDGVEPSCSPERVVSSPLSLMEDPRHCGGNGLLGSGMVPRATTQETTMFQVPYEVGVLRVFDFNSTVQRMSVVVRRLDRPHMELYCKGAPEVLVGLADRNTIPVNLATVLESYTAQGFRVIALAHRKLPERLQWRSLQRASRDKLERNLRFIGLLILKNPLKEASLPTVLQLRHANIRTVMATGDNVLTGISIARECGMVGTEEPVLVLTVTPPTAGPRSLPSLMTAELVRGASSQEVCSIDVFPDAHASMYCGYHLALSGTTWRLLLQYFPQHVGAVCCRGTVFGRMTPEQKAQLVEQLMALDYVVVMCGDGANDCGALKAAHVGISLSETEASVAAPFTSSLADISCVPLLIKEGRAALVTNFSMFKYMALYSLIQFTTVLMLYTFYTNLSDIQFMYIDLAIVTSMAVCMGYTSASSTLCRRRPCSSLLGGVTLFSVMVQVVAVVLGQVLAYAYLYTQPWFIPNKSDSIRGPGALSPLTWESTVLFCCSSLQYLALAFVYSIGAPFRKPLYTNYYLLVGLLLLGSISIATMVTPGPWCSWMRLKDEHSEGLAVHWLFRGTLLMMSFSHLLLALAAEDYINSSTFLKRVFQRLRCKREPKNKYKRVLAALEHDESFPPVHAPIAAVQL